MDQMVMSLGEFETSHDARLEDIEWELSCSAREVTGGFVPFANLDLMSALRAGRGEHRERLPPRRMMKLTHCPKCEGQCLIPVVAGRKMNYFCRECTICWHVSGDQVTRVNPWTCPGCALVTTACYEHFDLATRA